MKRNKNEILFVTLLILLPYIPLANMGYVFIFIHFKQYDLTKYAEMILIFSFLSKQ